MSAYDNLIANIDKTAYTTVWDMDKIIGTASGTIIAPAPPVGSSTTTTDTSPTAFGDSYYFQGIYSTDNGATWNDFGAMIPDLSTPGMPVFQTLDVGGAVGSAGTMNIIVRNYYDSVHGTGTQKTVLWRVIYFSKNRQGALNPQYIANKTLFTSVERNYQKIAQKGEVPFDISIGVAKSVTIAHNLGYVPFVRAFYSQTTPSVRIDKLWAGYFIDTRMTETTLTFNLDATYAGSAYTGNIEYRIYLDQ